MLGQQDLPDQLALLAHLELTGLLDPPALRDQRVLLHPLLDPRVRPAPLAPPAHLGQMDRPALPAPPGLLVLRGLVVLLGLPAPRGRLALPHPLLVQLAPPAQLGLRDQRVQFIQLAAELTKYFIKMGRPSPPTSP